MKKWMTKLWIVVCSLLVILVASFFYMQRFILKADTISVDEIQQQLENMYGAEVKDVQLASGIYTVEMERSKAAYQAKVDAETGKVLSLVQTKEVSQEQDVASEQGQIQQQENPSNHDNPTDESQQATKPTKDKDEPVQPQAPVQPSKPNSNEKTVFISKKRAKSIALQHLKPSVPYEIEDIVLEQQADGGFYLVEIELDSENDADEVTYQIHAISGKIMTVTWE